MAEETAAAPSQLDSSNTSDEAQGNTAVKAQSETTAKLSESAGLSPLCDCEIDDPFRPRWSEFEDPTERSCAHIVDMLGAAGHYIHVNGGGRSGRQPLLCALLKHEGQMSQRDLMCKFDLKAGSLSEVLSKLEKDGLIERTRDEADRRQLNVALTAEGKELAEAEQGRREKFRAEAFTCITDDERVQLEDMLTRINSHWRSLND